LGAKEVRVECPCCHSLLDVDVLTQKVMRVQDRRPQESGGLPEAGWSAAAARVQGRMSSAADKLEESMEREKGKIQRMDELFDEAARKLRRRGEENEPG
jgi:hypothetical protein